MRTHRCLVLVLLLGLGCVSGKKRSSVTTDSTAAGTDSTVLPASSDSSGAKPRGCFPE
jgi:hypothetical protein